MCSEFHAYKPNKLVCDIEMCALPHSKYALLQHRAKTPSRPHADGGLIYRRATHRVPICKSLSLLAFVIACPCFFVVVHVWVYGLCAKTYFRMAKQRAYAHEHLKVYTYIQTLFTRVFCVSAF